MAKMAHGAVQPDLDQVLQANKHLIGISRHADHFIRQDHFEALARLGPRQALVSGSPKRSIAGEGHLPGEGEWIVRDLVVVKTVKTV